MVGLIVVASFIFYVLRLNVSIVAGTMSRDLGLTEIQLGMIFSAFAAGYAIFQFPGGILGIKYGPRIVIASAAVVWGVLTVVTALIPGPDVLSVTTIFGGLIVLRFLTAATQAPFFPCVSGIIANWFPVGRWGLPNGLSSTGVTLGSAATAPLIVWLMSFAGWRGALLLTFPLAFILAAIWWWYLRDYPRDHDSVTRQELQLINANRPESQTAEVKGAWKLVLKNKHILMITVSYFCMNYVFYLFFSWFFYYLTEVKGFAASEAGFLTASLWVLGAVGATVGGFICDISIKRYGFRWGPAAICIAGLMLCAIFLFAGALVSNSYLAVALFGLSFACTQITEAAYWSTSTSIAERYTSAACGVMNTGGNAAGAVGAILVPWLAQYFGWTFAIASGGIFALIGAVLFLFVRADQQLKLD